LYNDFFAYTLNKRSLIFCSFVQATGPVIFCYQVHNNTRYRKAIPHCSEQHATLVSHTQLMSQNIAYKYNNMQQYEN